MKTAQRLSAALFLVSSCAAAWGPAAKTEQPRTVTQVLDRSVSNVEREFVPAADAMPEDKYSFAPTNGEFKGVRTFAQQVKHVAATNYLVASGILGEKPPVEVGGENGPDSMKSKADIMKFVKDSFAYAHKAVSSVDEKNLVAPMKDPFGEQPSVTRLGLASVFAWHSFDHYGQMVEYLRMNGIIPPASRQ
jgi:DinB family protein